MFVGHYGVSYAAKPFAPRVPLWVWFIAVQWLDVIWSVLVLTGIEKLRIVPGFTASQCTRSLLYALHTRLTRIDRPLADLWRRRGFIHARESRSDGIARGSRVIFTLDS